MITVMVIGKLIRDLKRGTASNGNTYATALLSVQTADGQVMVNCIAFAATAEQLLAHVRNDTIVVVGPGKLSSWNKDGQEHHDLSITADSLMTPYALKAKRQAVSGGEQMYG